MGADARVKVASGSGTCLRNPDASALMSGLDISSFLVRLRQNSTHGGSGGSRRANEASIGKQNFSATSMLAR